MKYNLRIFSVQWILLVSGAFLLLISSCRRELEPPEVENEVLTPLVKTNLSINQLVPDSLRSEDADGLVSLVYRNELYSASLDAFEELNSREFDQSAKLQQLRLSDRTVINSISLGQLVPGLGGFNGSMQPIPEITNLSFGPEVLDGSSYFDEITLDSGYMDVTIKNGLPTSLDSIEFEVRNQNEGNIVVDTLFDFVDAGATETRTMSIAGRNMESFLEAYVTKFDVNASNGNVLIDTSDAITVTVVIHDMKVRSAIAVFPAQNIIELNDTNLMENVGNTRVTRGIAKSGFVNVRVESTIEDTMYFEYIIPDGKKDGKPFEVSESINPAPSGGSIDKTFQYDVTGYDFDMRGLPVIDHYNVFYSKLIGRIDSTGRKVNITLEDSIRIFVSLSNFIPEYMEGYAGDTIVNVGPETVPITLFDKIAGGSMKFNAVNMALSIENGNGVPVDVDLKSLKAKNTESGKSVDVQLDGLPNPISVLKASDLDEPWKNTWSLDSRDNINNALSIFPNAFEASLSIATNPDKNRSDLSQFGVDSNQVKAYADIEIPLDFVAENLLLRDTVEFDGSSIQKPEGIGSGVLYLSAKNTFPLTAEMVLEFRLANGTLLQTVSFDKPLASGNLAKPNETVLAWEFDRTSFDKILESDIVVMSAKVNSPEEATKVYSTMAMGLTLSARFNYTQTYK